MNECQVCGADHGDLSHALAYEEIKAIQIGCPECGVQNCSGLFLIEGGQHVSWCENGHVVVGNAIEHLVVYKFL